MPRNPKVTFEFGADDKYSPELENIQRKTKAFIAGERSQHRQLQYVLRETGGAVQELSNTFVGPNGLGKGFVSVGNSASEFSFLLGGLNQTVGQGTGVMAKFINGIAPAGLAIGAFIGLVSALKGHNDEVAESLSKLRIEWAALQEQLNPTSTNAQVEAAIVAQKKTAAALKEAQDAVAGKGSALSFLPAWKPDINVVQGLKNAEAANTLALRAIDIAKDAATASDAKAHAEEVLTKQLLASKDVLQHTEGQLRLEFRIQQDLTQSVEARERAYQNALILQRQQKALMEGMAPLIPKGLPTPPGMAVSPAGKLVQNDLPQQLKGVNSELTTIGATEEQLKTTFSEVFQVGFEEAGNFYSVAEEGNATLREGIMEGIGGAWESVFGKANSLFEKLMQNMTTKLASNALNGLFKGLASLFPGGSFLSGLFGGFHSGGMIPKAHSGMDFRSISANKEFPVMVRGGEMVLTEDQQKAVGNTIHNWNIQAWDVNSFKRLISGNADIRSALVGEMANHLASGRN